MGTERFNDQTNEATMLKHMIPSLMFSESIEQHKAAADAPLAGTPVETDLKSDQQKSFRGRDVWIPDPRTRGQAQEGQGERSRPQVSRGGEGSLLWGFGSHAGGSEARPWALMLPGQSQPQARAPIPGSRPLRASRTPPRAALTPVVGTGFLSWSQGLNPAGTLRQAEGSPSPFQLSPAPAARRGLGEDTRG